MPVGLKAQPVCKARDGAWAFQLWMSFVGSGWRRLVTAILNNSLISNNVANRYGGGLFVNPGGHVTITNGCLSAEARRPVVALANVLLRMI
jgi:hypothetical protein